MSAQQSTHELKQHLGRARSFLNKNEFLKGLASFCEALKCFIKGHFVGSDRLEIEYRFEELISMIRTVPALSPYLTQDFKYVRGQERQLYKDTVDILHKIAEELKSQESSSDSGDNRELERRRLLEKMQELLSSQDKKAAAGQLKKIVDAYGDDPQIYVDIADTYYQACEYQEAVNYAYKALKMDSRQMKAFRIAINACRYQKNYQKAEALYKQALQVFGEHANIYLNLARLYREWGKLEAACENLSRAVELDPENDQAQALQQQLQKEQG